MNFVIFALAAVFIGFSSSTEDDFSRLFYDNKETFVDRRIVFENPLPKWLRGSLVRTGPGMFGNGPRNFTHAFDGFSKIHSWKFYGNGTASFSTNFVRSSVYNTSIKINNIDNYLTFEKPTPPFSLMQEELGILKGMDNMNINVYRFFNSGTGQYEYATLSDTWKMYQIDPLTVGTISPVNAMKPSVPQDFVSLMSSAHPVPEYGTGHHFTFLTSVSVLPGVQSRLSLMRIKSTYERELVAQWGVDKAPYMHSFSVTPNYVILLAAPYFVNVEWMLKNADAYSGLQWFPKEKANFYVIEIKTGKVTTISTPITNPTHHANAYEEDNNIIIDICTTKDPFFATTFEVGVIRDVDKRNKADFTPLFSRYTINLESKTAMETKFPPNSSFPFLTYFDIPAINENYRHKKHCFVYGVSFKKDFKSFARTALVKKDTCGKNKDNAWSLDGHFPMEMWFVPRPNSTEEDDGVLLTPVLNGAKKESYLMILNATTMTVMNRGYLNTSLPFTIHGRFFPDVV
ncbi:beta,beta-carotene 15,15'-dioxygenase-like [Mytilus galloprovincialis]|uniref:BCMO1 n=1 Tax=Mytilus edulis TaxID=6550 RepID=A0A8S3TVC6_MYTED|nr:unnamed protein product [Mytilus edulis]